jgi:hypothetical protein
VRTLRYTAVLAGIGIALYGVAGLLTAPEIQRPQHVGYWLLGGVVLHDAVLAPVVFLLCWLAARHTTPRGRGLLAAVLLIAGALTLLAAPILLHGRVAIR